LDSDCGADSEGAIQHEVLHSLGVMHEQSRPDRDEYITVNLANTNSTGAYTKMTPDVWQTMSNEEGGDFELNSVMMYGSKAVSNNTKAVAVTRGTG